jgi:hypothetical protein
MLQRAAPRVAQQGRARGRHKFLLPLHDRLRCELRDNLHSTDMMPSSHQQSQRPYPLARGPMG